MKPEQTPDGGCQAQPHPSVLPRQELPAAQGSPPTCPVGVKPRPQPSAHGERMPRVLAPLAPGRTVRSARSSKVTLCHDPKLLLRQGSTFAWDPRPRSPGSPPHPSHRIKRGAASRPSEPTDVPRTQQLCSLPKSLASHPRNPRSRTERRGTQLCPDEPRGPGKVPQPSWDSVSFPARQGPRCAKDPPWTELVHQAGPVSNEVTDIEHGIMGDKTQVTGKKGKPRHRRQWRIFGPDPVALLSLPGPYRK